MKKTFIRSALLGSAFIPLGASAAVPSEYTDAIAAVITDGTTMGTAAFASLVGFAVVMTLGAIAVRMVKKARSAA